MNAAASSAKAKVTLPSDEEILITREFDAPKELVYKAWTTPELVKRWWAGHRGEMTSVEMDVRVGGKWRYVMLAGGTHEIAFHGEYREILPQERIVNTEIFEMPGTDGSAEADAPLVTVTFTERDGHTTLTLLTETSSNELRDMIINSGMEGGMQEQMDMLEEIAISLR
jgi:uncharacterized protein YndB with AHSA1/START domain